MSWNDILNHENALERFRRSVSSGRLASTYLFVGPPGTGKRTFALKLAEALLCETNDESQLDPCGHCSACQQVRAASHPDLIMVGRPKDKAFIPVETFIGDREHRNQEGLCHDIGLKPFRGGRKIAIIDDADFLNAEGANCLLKTLEEPPAGSILILIGTSEQRQLSTIVSRSQVVRFDALKSDQVARLLGNMELPEDAPAIEQLAAASQGSVELAIELSDPSAFNFRAMLFSQLATHDPGSRNFAKDVTTFVDEAGKDSARKRKRLVRVGDFAISFFQDVLMNLSDVATVPGSGESVAEFIERLELPVDPSCVNRACELVSLCIERTMLLQHHVVANVNPANAIAAWLTDLGRICRGVEVPALSY
ncbi:MAG: DNA polymerase III subunit [Planctomycetota bacterium]